MARRCERFLTERWVWAGLDDDPQEALPALPAASIEGRSAVTGARAKRVQQLGARTSPYGQTAGLAVTPSHATTVPAPSHRS